MPLLHQARFHLFLFMALFCTQMVMAESIHSPGLSEDRPVQVSKTWRTAVAEHIYGFPGLKAHTRGTLTLDENALTFTSKSATSTIPRNSIEAASVGNERVELWGTTGRVLRAMIPDNGGVMIAAFAHHRIDMLSLEFKDEHGGMHGTVFFLGAHKTDHVLESFRLAPVPARDPIESVCQNKVAEPGSMVIADPEWSGAQVPDAYRVLMYEHAVDRFRRARGVTRIYRNGEVLPEGLCPQYTVRLAVSTFKEGSAVERAVLGPVGMFAGTTRMGFHAEVTDRTGTVNLQEEVKAAVRGESESTNVGDIIAKKLVKRFERRLRKSSSRPG